MKSLKVHENGRYLAYENNEPFFWLGDTAWEMFHKLNIEEVKHYLDTREKQGFNVIQATALAGHDGLRVPNAYGRLPLLETDGKYDPARPDENSDYDYWKHVDFAVDYAAHKGLYIAFLPTWGDKFNKKWGIGPEVFTPENAYIYGKWLGERYRLKPNIIWMLGGDRPLETKEHEDIIDAMASGLKEGDLGSHLITYHPSGAHSSTEYVKGKTYIDFHTVQSGHRTLSYGSFKLLRTAAEQDSKPYMDSEPRYEDIPAAFGIDSYLWNADDIRQNAYWNLMEGVCGHTYGNNAIWSFSVEKSDFFAHRWMEVLHREGAECMKYLLELRLSRPFFEFRPANELIDSENAVMGYQAAGRGEDYAFVYTPLGLPIRIYLDRLSGFNVKAQWFNPRNAEVIIYGVLPPEEAIFVPPTSGKGQDWVLILDALKRKEKEIEQ